MPKIETYTAQTAPGVPNQPLRFMESGEDTRTLQLTQQAGSVINQWGAIQGRVQLQSDSNELALTKAKYLGGIAQIHQDLPSDPEVRENPALYEQKFNEQLRALRQDLQSGLSNDRVKQGFGLLVAEEAPMQQVQARRAGLKLQTDQNMAELAVARETYARMAAEAVTTGHPHGAAALTEDYRRLVEEAVANQHMTKAEGIKSIQNFQADRQKHEMFMYARGGSASREKLRDLSRNGYFDAVDEITHVNMLTLADNVERAEEARTEAVLKKSDDVVTRNLIGEAHAGTLPQEQIDAIKQNKTWLNPRVGEHLQEIVDRQNKAGGAKVRDPIVGNIANQFTMQGPPTLARVEAERAALREHVLQNGPSEDSRIRFDHLDSMYNQMKAIGEAQIPKALRYVDKAMESTQPQQPLTPHARQRIKNFEVIDRATIERELMRPGADLSKEAIDKRVEQLRKQRQERYKQKTPQQLQSDQFSSEGR